MYRMLLLGCLLAVGFWSCKKDKIAPPNQKDAFVKYYGHIRDQKASDVKRTADGGYLLLGSSNSFSSTADDDYYLIKTDSLGNEEWSKTFGDGVINSDEEGVAIVVLANDEGYLIAGNRTKITLVGNQSIREETNIVLYKLDATGTVVWEKLLRPSGTGIKHFEYVKDIKQTPDGGFILIGETTRVNTSKNNYTNYISYDKQDILVLKLDSEGVQQMQSIRGFVGIDYGASIEMVNGDYIIVGTADVLLVDNPSAPVFQKKVLAAKLKGSSLNEIVVFSFGDPNMYLTASYSAYDTISGMVTILAHVDDLASVADPREGDLYILQVTENVVESNSLFIGKTSGGINGIDRNLKGGAIALIPPQQQGDASSFIITATHDVGQGGSECVLLKMNSDLTMAWDGNARFFGRAGESGNWLPGNESKRVIPTEELVPNTTRKELTGFAFTGTFNKGTNNMIGLIKTNPDGQMTPIN